MIVLITGQFQVYDRAGHPIPGKKEWGISHGVDVETGENVCMSGGTPQQLGAVWHPEMCEWVLVDKDEVVPL